MSNRSVTIEDSIGLGFGLAFGWACLELLGGLFVYLFAGPGPQIIIDKETGCHYIQVSLFDEYQPRLKDGKPWCEVVS